MAQLSQIHNFKVLLRKITSSFKNAKSINAINQKKEILQYNNSKPELTGSMSPYVNGKNQPKADGMKDISKTKQQSGSIYSYQFGSAYAHQFGSIYPNQFGSIYPHKSGSIYSHQPTIQICPPLLNNATSLRFFNSLSIMKNIQPLQSLQKAHFSTSRTLRLDMPGSKETTPSIDECKSRKGDTFPIPRGACPTMPPCLKYVKPPGRYQVNTSQMECGRICMPCCPKARYPPVCFFPAELTKCEVCPNPRPSYSECQKNLKPCPIEVCDCCVISPPPCRLLPEIEECP